MRNMVVTVALAALLLASAGVEASRSGRTLLQQQRTAASKASTSGTTSGTVSSGSSSGSSSNTPRVFDPLGPSPFKDTQCKVPPKGQTYIINGYPSTPFPMKPYVFAQKFQPLPVAKPTVSATTACKDGVCIEGYEFTMEEVFIDFGFKNTSCEGKSVPMLGYNGLVPGAMTNGHPACGALFTNKVDPKSKYFPPAGPGNAGSTETKDICEARGERMLHYPELGHGAGQGFSIHHRGEASTADMDGWAEQYMCAGETKDYMLPNNRPATLWFHDHAVGTTSENVYAGLAGMNLVRPCSAAQDPLRVEGFEQEPVTEHQLMIADMVLSYPRKDEGKVCRLCYDRQGVHKDDLWGDINLVNGVPWPYLGVNATWNRFRILAASVSRPWILQLWDASGTEVSSKICKILGGEGGNTDKAKDWPANGLLTDAAYRWDVVCNFTAYTNTSLYLINKPNLALTTSLTPFYCYSHLIMRIDVGETDPNAGVPNLGASNPERASGPLSSDVLQTYKQRALRGESDRQLEFGKGGGLWVFNGRGWDYKGTNIANKNHIEFDDVGQNDIELWKSKAGGGWTHPIHVHLIDFFCLAIDGQPCPPEYDNMPKDVLHIGANVGEVIVAARFGPHLGEYMMHCHNGVHEDDEMMRAFMVSDSMHGKTFGTTPSFNVKLLNTTTSDAKSQWGDWRDTTYVTADAPQFDIEHVKGMLGKGYYDIFYPPPGSPLKDATNFWLPGCPAKSSAK